MERKIRETKKRLYDTRHAIRALTDENAIVEMKLEEKEIKALFDKQFGAALQLLIGLALYYGIIRVGAAVIMTYRFRLLKLPQYLLQVPQDVVPVHTHQQ